MLATIVKEKMIRPNISGGPIRRAKSARRRSEEREAYKANGPAMKDEIAAIAKACAALPCLAI